MSLRGLRLAILASQLSIAAGAAASVVEYLYVEANAGSSAGGHVAVRFGDRVYDFQNAELGTLRLRRSQYADFRYLYSVLENRTIHVAPIPVSGEQQAAIRDRFNRHYLVQNKHFDVLRSLRADRDLIRRLRARQADPETSLAPASREGPRLRGGWFAGEPAGGEESAALAGLRSRVAARHGPAFLGSRLDELEDAVAALTPALDGPSPAPASREQRTASGYHFADHYRDLCSKILALRTLRAARALPPDTLRPPAGRQFDLDARERRKLRAFADWLEAGLVDLVASERPDWGFPVLLGLARLQALHASLESGRLIVLDAFPEDANVLAAAAVRRRDPYIVERYERRRKELARARSHFAATERIREADFAWLEESAGRYGEFQRGFADGRGIRVRSGGLLPSAPAEAMGMPLPQLDEPTLRRAEAAALRREDAYVDALRAAFGYHLMTRNCVTELFATIAGDSSAPESGATPATGAFDFIPFAAYGSVLDAYAIAEVGEIPSYRRTRLEAMYAAENDLAVRLRESNTLTSTIYRRNDRDSFFLFFTDDAVPLRPLYGSLNLVGGIGEMAVGVLRAPWDRGRMLWSGVKGAAFSLPELFFVNLRKGILEYAPGDPPRTAMRTRSRPSGKVPANRSGGPE